MLETTLLNQIINPEEEDQRGRVENGSLAPPCGVLVRELIIYSVLTKHCGHLTK